MSDKFDFLKKKQEDQVDWEQRKQQWLKDINTLYTKIRQWLREPVEENLLTITEPFIDISEQYIGRYSAHKLIISSNDSSFELVPIGTLILGAKGRVDLKSYKGVVKLLKVDGDWSIRTETSSLEKLTEDRFIELMKWALE